MEHFNLDKYLKNPSMNVVTRDGRDVKILCTNYYLGNQCVIAEVEDIDRSFSFNQYSVQYGTTGDSPLDLFFATKKYEGWINIFEDFNGNSSIEDPRIFTSKEDAEKDGKDYDYYITTIKIEWER